jgi:dTDP-4-amino-4,6-dideoxygalactose transaminase
MQGGIILTNNDNYATTIRELVSRYAKITEVNALICLYSIANYDRNQVDRMYIIGKYLNLIKKPIYKQRIDKESNFSVFGVLFESKEVRDRVRRKLTRHEIETKVYYEPIVKGLENTDYLFEHILCLPVYQGMRDNIEHICFIINEA